MGAMNNISFKFFCQFCNTHTDGRAQCHAAASFSGNSKFDRLCDIDYKIGDKMHWLEGQSEENTWPSSYSFIRSSFDGSLIIVEPCSGICVSCKKIQSFYFIINNLQIMRLIGEEDHELNDLSVKE